jgi:hypothetical protein
MPLFSMGNLPLEEYKTWYIPTPILAIKVQITTQKGAET